MSLIQNIRLTLDGERKWILDDQEAQELLMAAVPVDESYRHLVAKKNGRYYSFRCHYENCYHGYWDNTMSEKNRNIVDRNFT